ncbi:MAG TPA: hypothetical protein VGP65_08320, partial [Candidatus Angelobacter sp.]|nr:hypothetical protein [Candidatus Angelobacter sp.]
TKAFVTALGKADADIWVPDFLSLAREGFAVLRPAEPRGEAGVVFPWRLLLPPMNPKILTWPLLAQFGIGLGSTPATARAVCAERFPNVPAAVIGDQNLELLGQISLWDFQRGRIWDDLEHLDKTIDFPIKPSGGSGTIAGSGGKAPLSDLVAQIEACLKNVEIRAHWWGFEFCFDKTCGDFVANVLMTAGAPLLITALKALVQGTGIIAGVIAAAGGLVAAAIEVIGFYTGVSMAANNTEKGVCLQCIWPITGGFVWWAAGR